MYVFSVQGGYYYGNSWQEIGYENVFPGKYEQFDAKVVPDVL
jgi:hypothetical protein